MQKLAFPNPDSGALFRSNPTLNQVYKPIKDQIMNLAGWKQYGLE